jgi:predicted RNase H-like HicB family nuclease
MLNLRLYLETIAGDWFGWIEDYPGALVQGETPQEVERAGPSAFTDYLVWLRSHGEPLDPALSGVTSADVWPTVAATVCGQAASAAEATHFMRTDGAKIQPRELDACLRLLSYSRASLIDAAGSVPPHEWDRAPFGGRSIRAWIQWLGDGERAMLARIAVQPAIGAHPDPLTALGRARAAFETAVRDAHRRAESGPIIHDGAPWSLAKVLRLAIWQERYATGQIAARSNPAAYLRSVTRPEAVVYSRDTAGRKEAVTAPAPSEEALVKHTHASAYYY